MANFSAMSPDEVFALLKRIMVREFDLKEDAILPSSSFEELDMDSIDAVDLAVSVEEAIGFQFDAQNLAELRTLQDVIDLICGTPSSPSRPNPPLGSEPPSRSGPPTESPSG